MNFNEMLIGGGLLAIIIWTLLCKHWERIENRNYAEMCERYGEDYLP